MSTLDTILSRAARRVAQSETKAAGYAAPPWALASAAIEKWNIPDASESEAQADLYTKLSWIQTAIETVAQMAAASAFEVRKRQGEGDTAIANHPFEVLLQQPNELQSRFEFLEATFSYRRLTGNCYWWLNRSGPDAEPEEIWIIPSNQIQPVPDGKLYIRGYKYDPGDGRTITLEPWEIVHHKVFNPSNKFVGLSAVQSLNIGARGDLAAQTWSTNFYAKDNAKVAGILAFADPIDPTVWEKMQKETARQYGGAKNKRLMMIQNAGKGGVEWLSTQMSQQDMQHLEQRQFTKEEVWSRLAPGLASMLAINSNEANARSADATMRALAVYPAQVSVAERVSLSILPVYGDNLVGIFDDPRLKDRQLELQEIQEYARYHTIDEIRKEYYDDTPLGDPRGILLPAEVTKGLTDARKPEDKPKPIPFGGQGGGVPAPQQPTPEAAMVEAGKALDRRRWRDKAVKALAAGRPMPDFDPDYLSDGETMQIRAALKRAVTADDVWRAVEG
jgi:HK97 family phage portal protein